MHSRLILDLHLDSPLTRVRRHMERLDSLLEREAVSHERLQVDQAARYEPEGFGVLVGVAVLELEVDLVCGQVAEWELRYQYRKWSRNRRGRPRSKAAMRRGVVRVRVCR